MRYFIRLLLLMAGFALTTAGLMGWRDAGFSFDAFWPLAGAARLHPLHLLMVGLAMIPPALRGVYMLERQSLDDRRRVPAGVDRFVGRS